MSRFLDRGALAASGVGVGVALVLVIAVGLVIPIQPLVFLLALPAGALVGAYANVRSERRRPPRRVVANALWAGAVTGLALALVYLAVRLIFVYADTGTLPDNTRLDCASGPECGYLRLVEGGYAAELAQAGIIDAATYERAKLSELAYAGLLLFGLAFAGAALAGGVQGVSAAPGAPRQAEAG